MSVLLRQPSPPPTLGIVPAALPAWDAAGAVPRKVPRRDRIWDLSPNLHCSVIGTCLTTGELRQLFGKLGNADAKAASSHSIHHRAVQAAGREDLAGKLLNKLLDRKHDGFVRRFAKAATRDALAVFWRAALEAGDIAGAYWATLTHPLCDDALVREAFGEVHMLSHLVGTSNRLDLARLRRLEEDLAERDETIARQQARLHLNAIELCRRQERIEALERITRAPSPEPARPADDADRLGLLRRADAAEARCRRLESERDGSGAQMRDAQTALAAAKARETDLLHELEELNAWLAAAPEEADTVSFEGATLLYVGGRPGQVEQLRDLTQKRGGTLLAHDGGIENSHGLLPGLVARADAVFFPVDCVSHGAVAIAKKHCRDAGKPFVPLRHASVACFANAVAEHLKMRDRRLEPNGGDLSIRSGS